MLSKRKKRRILSWLVSFTILSLASFAQADVGEKSELTPIRFEDGERVHKSFKFDIHQKSGVVDYMQVEAEVITEADSGNFKKMFDSYLKKVVKNNPNARISLKLLVKDPQSGEKHIYEPNRFFEYKPDSYESETAVETFLKKGRTNKENMSLAAVRFVVNGGLTTVALVAGGTPLLSAGLIAGGVAGFSAFFTAFPSTYVEAIFHHRFFKKSKIANYKVMGIATVEQMVKMLSMEIVISLISPIGLSSIGVVNDMSMMAFSLLTLKIALGVSIAQTLAERAMEEGRRRGILEKVLKGNDSLEEASKKLHVEMKKFNRFTVIASASTMVIMVAGMYGAMHGVQFLEYASTVTLVGLGLFGVYKQIKLNPLSVEEKKYIKELRARQIKKSKRSLAETSQFIADNIKIGIDKTWSLLNAGLNSSVFNSSLAPEQELSKVKIASESNSKKRRIKNTRKRIALGLNRYVRAEMNFLSKYFRGNTESENRMATGMASVINSLEKNMFSSSGSCKVGFGG